MEKKRDYHDLIRRIQKLQEDSPYFQIHTPGNLAYDSKEYPFFVLFISQDQNPFQQNKRSVCLSAGIHGDEPAGVEALLSILESQNIFLPYLASFDFMVFPCINPSGFENHRRENPAGLDLNRQFKHASPPLEVAWIKEMIHSIPFEAHLDFHEDVDTPGFYLYEVAQEGASMCGKQIIDAVSYKYPINLQEQIEGRFARNGVIGRNEQNETLDFNEIVESNPNWPLAFYFFSKGTTHSLTFETPVHLSMKERVEIHSIAFFTVLNALITLSVSEKSFKRGSSTSSQSH